MKKGIFVILLLVAVVGLIALAVMPTESTHHSNYLRIHIRANSDSYSDQQVKFEVRNAVVSFLTPLLANSHCIYTAKATVNNNLSEIERVTNSVLRQNNKNYLSNASLVREDFPTRAYFNGLTLPRGIYDAIIINLGTGEGANWWCVAFPPLCFIPVYGSREVRYRSRILEIINDFQNR